MAATGRDRSRMPLSTVKAEPQAGQPFSGGSPSKSYRKRYKKKNFGSSNVKMETGNFTSGNNKAKQKPKQGGSKKQSTNNKQSTNVCPVPNCLCTANLKGHALEKHIPSVFYEFTDENILMDEDLQEKRIAGLRRLTDMLCGVGAPPVALINYYNVHIQKGCTLSNMSLKAMYIFCEITGWPQPKYFEISPVNSLATLLNWFALLHLIAELNDVERLSFTNEFHDQSLTAHFFRSTRSRAAQIDSAVIVHTNEDLKMTVPSNKDCKRTIESKRETGKTKLVNEDVKTTVTVQVEGLPEPTGSLVTVPKLERVPNEYNRHYTVQTSNAKKRSHKENEKSSNRNTSSDLSSNRYSHTSSDLSSNRYSHTSSDLSSNRYSHTSSDLSSNRYSHEDGRNRHRTTRERNEKPRERRIQSQEYRGDHGHLELHSSTGEDRERLERNDQYRDRNKNRTSKNYPKRNHNDDSKRRKRNHNDDSKGRYPQKLPKMSSGREVTFIERNSSLSVQSGLYSEDLDDQGSEEDIFNPKPRYFGGSSDVLIETNDIHDDFIDAPRNFNTDLSGGQLPIMQEDVFVQRFQPQMRLPGEFIAMPQMHANSQSNLPQLGFSQQLPLTSFVGIDQHLSPVQTFAQHDLMQEPKHLEINHPQFPVNTNHLMFSNKLHIKNEVDGPQSFGPSLDVRPRFRSLYSMPLTGQPDLEQGSFIARQPDLEQGSFVQRQPDFSQRSFTVGGQDLKEGPFGIGPSDVDEQLNGIEQKGLEQQRPFLIRQQNRNSGSVMGRSPIMGQGSVMVRGQQGRMSVMGQSDDYNESKSIHTSRYIPKHSRGYDQHGIFDTEDIQPHNKTHLERQPKVPGMRDLGLHQGQVFSRSNSITDRYRKALSPDVPGMRDPVGNKRIASSGLERRSLLDLDDRVALDLNMADKRIDKRNEIRGLNRTNAQELVTRPKQSIVQAGSPRAKPWLGELSEAEKEEGNKLLQKVLTEMEDGQTPESRTRENQDRNNRDSSSDVIFVREEMPFKTKSSSDKRVTDGKSFRRERPSMISDRPSARPDRTVRRPTSSETVEWQKSPRRDQLQGGGRLSFEPLSLSDFDESPEKDHWKTVANKIILSAKESATTHDDLKANENVYKSGMGSQVTKPGEHQEKEVKMVQPPVQYGNHGNKVVQGFDSYFHLDIITKWMLKEGVNMETMEVDNIVNYIYNPVPHRQVELVGGVIVYNDPETFKDVQFPLNAKWKVAIGVSPTKVHLLNDDRLALLQSLVFNPLISAIGGIGLDGSNKNLQKQEEVLERVLGLCTLNRPLLLHIREKKSDDVYVKYPLHRRCLEIVTKKCNREQRIHIHCFTADVEVMMEWMSQFPNCMFGFCGRADRLDYHQKKVIQNAPLSKLLLETGSPYFQINKKLQYNTPAYLGDVADQISSVKMMPSAVLLDVTAKNAKQFYRVSK